MVQYVDENTAKHESEKIRDGIIMLTKFAKSGCRNPDQISYYCDFLVQGKKKLHERAALNPMIDRYSDSVPAILIADRGYESFNVFAHLIQKDMKFVIRMKDIYSNGILSAYDLPDGEVDTYIRTTLTKRHTKETLGNPDIYTIIQPATDFDFLNENCACYDIRLNWLGAQPPLLGQMKNKS